MRKRNLVTFLAAGVLVLGLSSCSDDDPPGQPELPQTPSVPEQSVPQANPGLPHSGAPKVEAPIADTAPWEADPCTLISGEQLQSAGLKPTEPQRDDAPTGPGCYWEFDPETVSGFAASLATTGGRDGLSNVYKLKEMGQSGHFEELPAIEGLPAVIAAPKDETADGICSVAVGLRDDLVFGVDMTADPSTEQGKDPCGWAAKLAALAVQTMKGSA